MSFLAGLTELGRPAAPAVPALSLQLPKRGTKAESAHVWSRGVTRWFRCSLSVADSFVCRCLTSCTMLPSSHPAHRTGYADFRFRLSEKPPGDLMSGFATYQMACGGASVLCGLHEPYMNMCYRKFSTSMMSALSSSICVYKIQCPSGETDRVSSKNLLTSKTGRTFLVAKSKYRRDLGASAGTK